MPVQMDRINPKGVNGILYASNFPGADIGAKINAADALLGLKGGEIWVSKAAGTTISTPVSLRNTLRFTDSASYSVSATITVAHGGIRIYGTGLNDIGSSNPGTLLTWTGSAGSDLLSILGTVSNRLDKVIISDLIVDGGNTARYTIRAEKIDSLELHSMRFRNGATASFYAVDATGIKFFGVSSGVNPSYAAVLDWGTGGFSWFGGAIENDLSASVPLILVQGACSNILFEGLEMDATSTSFGGFIQTNGYDTNSSFAGAPTGGAGAPNNVTIHGCSFFYDLASGSGGTAAVQGADILVTGTATRTSNSVSVRNSYFAGLSVGTTAVKVDQSSNFSIVNCVSNAHTTATLNLTANATFNRLEYVTGTDVAVATGAGAGSRLEIKQGTNGLFSLPNSAISAGGSVTGGGLIVTQAAPTVSAGQVGLGSTHATTVGAAGGATALPATPTGYLIINVDGTAQKIPYYAN